MKTPSFSDILAHYSHSLQLAAPKEWKAFVEHFDAYATDVTVAVTTAAQHEVLQQQGKAQAFLHLLRLFQNCHSYTPSQTPPSV